MAYLLSARLPILQFPEGVSEPSSRGNAITTALLEALIASYCEDEQGDICPFFMANDVPTLRGLESPSVDFEDWAEQVDRILSALQTGEAVFVLSRHSDDRAGRLSYLAADDESPLSDRVMVRFAPPGIVARDLLDGGVFLGYDMRSRHALKSHFNVSFFDGEQSHVLARRYDLLCGWDEVSGRFGRTVPVDFQEGDLSQLAEVLDRLHRGGSRRAFLKDVRAKTMVATVDLSALDGADETDRLDRAEGVARSLFMEFALASEIIVQAYIEMCDEIRFFVLDGRIVGSAGQVSEDVPCLFSDEERRHIRFRARPDHLRVHHGDEADRYRDAMQVRAQEIVDFLVFRNAGLESFVIDMARLSETPRDDTARFIPVELNPLLNAGTFAFSWKALLEARL